MHGASCHHLFPHESQIGEWGTQLALGIARYPKRNSETKAPTLAPTRRRHGPRSSLRGRNLTLVPLRQRHDPCLGFGEGLGDCDDRRRPLAGRPGLALSDADIFGPAPTPTRGSRPDPPRPHAARSLRVPNRGRAPPAHCELRADRLSPPRPSRSATNLLRRASTETLAHERKAPSTRSSRQLGTV